MSKFKEGDKIYSSDFGFGVVEEVNEYHVAVDFENDTESRVFDHNGARRFRFNPHPSATIELVNELYRTEFKKGDRVYSLRCGWGIVDESYRNCLYKVGVLFDDANYSTFTGDGREFVSDARTLYFGEPDFSEVECTIDKPKKNGEIEFKATVNVEELDLSELSPESRKMLLDKLNG